MSRAERPGAATEVVGRASSGFAVVAALAALALVRERDCEAELERRDAGDGLAATSVNAQTAPCQPGVAAVGAAGAERAVP